MLADTVYTIGSRITTIPTHGNCIAAAGLSVETKMTPKQLKIPYQDGARNNSTYGAHCPGDNE